MYTVHFMTSCQSESIVSFQGDSWQSDCSVSSLCPLSDLLDTVQETEWIWSLVELEKNGKTALVGALASL